MKQASLLRPAILIAWALLILGGCQSGEPNPTTAGSLASNRAKILVTANGFYQISADTLAAAGIEFDAFSAETLQLSQNGRSVPFYFNDGTLVFYGQTPTSRYTNTRPYLLETGADGMFMSETAVSPTNTAAPQPNVPLLLHLEENHIYEPQSRSQNEGDVWFWQKIRQGQSIPLTFSLPAVADGSGALTLNLKGVTYNHAVENDHDLDVLINGNPIGAVQFDGEIFHTAVLELPPGTLQPGQNEILLDNTPEGAAFLDIMLLNWAELTYNAPAAAVSDQITLQPTAGQVTFSGFSETPLLFDISDPAAPVRLTGAETTQDGLAVSLTDDEQAAAVGPAGYVAPAAIDSMRASDWRNPEQQADLLILTTDELAPALEPLITAREAEGLAVKLVPVAEIYDEFGGGEATPESLQAFIAYAHQNWQPPQPRYLLLVGDATSDYHGYLETPLPANHVPSFLVPVAYSGETVSDSRLADVDGDTVPDLAVGRWPVNTVEEAASLVARTLAYEQGTAVNQALFAADGTENQFTSMSQAIADSGGLPAASTQILTGPQSGEVTDRLNDGAWLAAYVGHGSLNQWGKEQIFTRETLAGLDVETPPILVQLTCLTGLFAQPDQRSLTEEMLLHDSGPVLSIAATSLTLSSHQEPFATSFVQALLDPEITRIGDAFQAAKLSLDVSNPGLREISDTFALFGDPSARINRPAP
ncbi:MAG: C25 family cysteine peptidase [Chloroflexota bacterium]